MAVLKRTLPLELVFLAVIAPAIALSTAGFGYLTYVRLYRTILEGFDRKLAALSSTTSVYLDPDEMTALLARKPALRDAGQDPEQQPSYLKYVLPMRQIREKAGLTFIYAQMLTPGTGHQCVYLVDGTVGQGHSELGAIDTIPDQDWDVALRVQHDGAVAQTDIRRWEQWGLLKCGWAPMYSKDGQIKAMAGTDVEITIIRQKTYAALLATLGVGALTLVLAGIVSVRVARKLTHPLGQVREASLRIASGDYAFRCALHEPREIGVLAAAVNRLAQVMETALDDARPRLLEWRRQRGLRALVESLTMRPYRSRELAIALDGGLEASGFAVAGPLALLWMGDREPDELAARKTARDIEHVARPLLDREGAAAARCLPSLLPRKVIACALIDLRDWSVHLQGIGFEAIALETAPAHAAPPRGSPLRIASGETIVVRSDSGATITPDLRGMEAGLAADALASAVAAAVHGIAAVVCRPAQTGEEHAA